MSSPVIQENAEVLRPVQEDVHTQRELVPRRIAIHDIIPTFTAIPAADSFFASRNAVIDHLNDIAVPMGFSIVITESRKDRETCFLGCWRSGNPRSTVRNQADRQREGTTQKCACPLKIKVLEDQTTWSWSWAIISPHHNHGATIATALPRARRLNPTAAAQIQGLSVAGVTPKRIQTVLSASHPTLPLARKDIANYVYR